MIYAIILRDLRLAWRGGAWLPILFMLLVAMLYPFAVGPDAALLTKTGGAVVWIAALLAALLPVDQLLAPDHEAGFLDQYAVRGVAEEQIALAKWVAHWLSFGPLAMIAAIPAAALLGLDQAALVRLEICLALGTPGLAALGLIVAGLTLGLKRAGALAGLLMLPLAIPLLIFGAGSLALDGTSAVKLLAAMSLFLVAITPFAVAASLRAARE